MQKSAVGKGRIAEDIALGHVRALGWQVLGTRVRTAAGEIDILARENGVLVVIEVKARTGARHGDCLEAVGPAKVRRLLGAALCWLSAAGPRVPARVRVDVIAVGLCGGVPLWLRHHRDVLGE